MSVQEDAEEKEAAPKKPAVAIETEREGGRPSWQIPPSSLGRASEEDGRSSSSHPMWVSQTESCSAKAGQGSPTPALRPPATTTFLSRAKDASSEAALALTQRTALRAGLGARAESANHGFSPNTQPEPRAK